MVGRRRGPVVRAVDYGVGVRGSSLGEVKKIFLQEKLLLLVSFII